MLKDVQLRNNRARAIQFTGWTQAEGIHKWIPETFFVPEGYEHYLRRKEEFEYSGHVNKHAPPFLVYTDGGDTRIDQYWWIVEKAPGQYEFLNQADFKAKYEFWEATTDADRH